MSVSFIKCLRPNVGVGRGFDELNVHPDHVTAFLHFPPRVRHAKLMSDISKVFRHAPVVLRRGPRDHLQIGDLRKTGQDLVLNAVGKIGIFFFAASIFERKHRDALFRYRTPDFFGPWCRKIQKPPINEIAPRGSAMTGQILGGPVRGTPSRPPFELLEFRGRSWIAEAFLVQIENLQPQTVFHLAFAEIVQVRLPVPILGEVLGDNAWREGCARRRRSPSPADQH